MLLSVFLNFSRPPYYCLFCLFLYIFFFLLNFLVFFSFSSFLCVLSGCRGKYLLLNVFSAVWFWLGKGKFSKVMYRLVQMTFRQSYLHRPVFKITVLSDNLPYRIPQLNLHIHRGVRCISWLSFCNNWLGVGFQTMLDFLFCLESRQDCV